MASILAFLLSLFIFLLSKIIEKPKKLSPGQQEKFLQKACPSCASHHLVKNGSIHNGKPKYKCKSCSRQFIDNPTNTTILCETKQLVDRLTPYLTSSNCSAFLFQLRAMISN